MAKRIFAFVLVLAMLVSLMPQVTIGVSAEGAKAPGASALADHTNHDGWTNWGDDESEWTTLPTAAGKYYLTHDVTMTAAVTISANVDLCLNGHTVTQTKSGARHIYLNEGKGITFSLYDCGTTGTITGGSAGNGTVINVTRTNTFKMYGGKITGNNSTSDAVIYVQAAKDTHPTGGVFYMYGGEISGNKVKNGVVYGAGGDANYTNSQVNIYGGTIKDNEVTGSGGAIYVKSYGSLHVENATITGNKAIGGGGSAIYAEGRTPIYIKNTTITGNIGTASGATALDEGYSAAVYLCGVDNTLTLSGKVVISGNTTAAANIADLMFKNDNFDSLQVDELTAGSDIVYRTRETTPTTAGEVIEITQGGSQTGIWQSEWITYMDSTGATKNITYGDNGGTKEFFFVDGHYHGNQKFVAWDKTDRLPNADENGVGYYLPENITFTTISNELKAYVQGGKTLHLCLNGKTVTRSGTAAGEPLRVADGSLYLSDCTATYDADGYLVSGGKIQGFQRVGNGAGLYVYKADSIVEVQGVEFVDNVNTETNEAYGGAAVQARLNTTPVKFIGCKFTNNQSKNVSTGALVGGAGAIALREGGKVTAEKCLFTGNRAKHGAAIYCTGSTLVVKDSKFTGNNGDNAVAINVLGTSNVTIDSCTITDNFNTSEAGYGAVNLANGNSTVKIQGKTVIYDNLNKDNKQQNMHLQYSTTTDIDYDVSGLAAGSKVGVSLFADRFTNQMYFSTTGMTSNPGYCISDHEDYEVALNATTGRLELVEKSTTPPAPNTHTHKLCNDASCTAHGADVTFDAWGDDATETGLPTSGSWYLVDSVTVSAATSINSELKLCLNGKTITQTGSARIYTVNAGGALTITDCATAYDGTTYTGGLITGGKHNTGSAVYVTNGTTFNLYGGRITNCGPSTTTSAQTGAPVFLHSANSAGATFNMYGGEITNCGGDKSWGGAVSNGGGNAGKTVYANMYGGKIFGNTAGNGGAFRMRTDAVVTISGGEIYGNHATATGGAIYMELNKGDVKLNLQGGNIHDNTAATNGGAIYVGAGVQDVTVSGAAFVQNNKVGTAQNNLYLAGDVKLTVGQLATGAKIGLSKDAARTQEQISTAALASEAVLSYFESDDQALVPGQDAQGYLILKANLPNQVHKLCGDASCTEHADVTFQPWTSTTTLPPSGNWYLVDNVNVSAATTVSDDLNLCLNGKTITQTTQNRVFTVNSDKVLSITDCGTTGTITGGRNDFGAVTYLYEGATFNLFGGKLTNNGPKSTSAATGATVFMRSNAKGGATFNMYGGEITGNGGDKSWGGAASNGSGTAGNTVYVNMYGGKIYGNTALNGGAFRMMTAAEVAIYGGEIYNNTATETGGAIYLDAGATLKLEGGKIYDNTAATNGGGIYATSSAGMITLSKTPVVENNKVGSALSNLHLAGDSLFTVSGLTTGAKIGLSRDENRSSEIVSTNVVTAGDMAHFTNDNAVDYQLKQKNDYVALTVFTDHMHNICNSASCTDHTDEVPFKKWEKTDSLPPSGNWYLANNVELTAATSVSGNLNLCLNGKTITQTTENRIFTVAGNKTLSVTDCGTNGTITGGKNDFGSVAYLNEGATFNLFGGKLTGNTPKTATIEAGDTSTGAVVFLRSASKGGATFNMYGGEITGNGGEKCWGGAASNGSGNAGKPVYVNMYGGKIYGNTALNGGAFRMENASVTTIYGGEIYGNNATASGGAIYLTKGAELHLAGGKITGNTAPVGGGIYLTDTGKISVSGNPVVMDNLEENRKSNLYLSGNAIITLGDVKEAARIGISVTNVGRAITTQSDTDYSKNFAGDSAYKIISYKDKALWIEGSTDHQHCVCAGAASGCDHSNQIWTAWESTTSLPNTSGYFYLTADVQMSTATSIPAGQKVYLCLNGKTVTAAEGKRLLMTTKNSVLNLTDCNKNPGMLTGGTQTWGAAVNINAGSTFNMFGGKISGNKSLATSGGIGAIYVQGAGSTFNMYGGEISGNESASGTIYSPGGIAELMYVNIYGGTIENNTSVKVKDSQGKTVSTSGRGGAMYLSANTILNIYGGSIKNNTAEADGGAIMITGKGAIVTMTGGEISGNKAANGGGLITLNNAKFILEDGVFQGNEAVNGGGGFYISTNTELVMNGGLVTGNKSGGSGAGFYVYRSKATLNGGEVSGNIAANRAGGFAFCGAQVEVNKIVVKNNEAKEGGAAYINRASSGSGENIKYYPSIVNINEGALITGNKAVSNCGGILMANDQVVVTMNGGEISKNESTNGAGVMTWKGSTFVMKGGKITGHKIKGSGGGIYVSTASTFKMEGGQIVNNTAKSGGGAYFLRSTVELNGGTIGNNYAKQEVKWTNGKETKSGGTAGGVYISGSTVKLNGTAINGNKADSNGGGIVTGRATYKENGVTKYDLVKFDIYGGSISNNTANDNAGGMLMQSKGTVVNMYGGRFTGNKATANGGAIYVSTDTTFNMTGGTITGNHTEKSGGAFYCYKSTANITGGNIHTNTATSSAGMLNAATAPCVVTIKNIKIYGNESKTAGALVSQSKATLYVENCEIYDNKSTSGQGGAVFVSNRYSNGYFTNCKFFDNSSAGMGGAVFCSDFSDSSFTNCEFYRNHSDKQGGAVEVYIAATSIMENCTFAENTAADRGGALAIRGDVVMTDCLVENNTATTDGGGIYTDVNTTTGSGIMEGLEMHNCQVKNNVSGGMGGGFYIFKGCRAELYDTEVTGNKAAAEGGAIWAYEDLELHNTTITGNTSGGEGYAVYMSDANYDGHSYFTSRNKMSGNVIIKDNQGGDLWMGKDVVIAITADGLGTDAHIELTLDSGVVTNRLFGAYHYEGGEQVYTITHGDRSITDPEYDASLVPGAKGDADQADVGDVILYAVIGVFVVAVAAVVALLIAKKKKAGKTAEKVNKE